MGITFFAWSTDAVTTSNLTLSLKINKRTKQLPFLAIYFIIQQFLFEDDIAVRTEIYFIRPKKNRVIRRPVDKDNFNFVHKWVLGVIVRNMKMDFEALGVRSGNDEN